MSTYMKETSYIIIQGWMRTRLRLTGNDLICFALIFGFSQDGESVFTGSLKYIQEAIGVATRQSVLNILARLEAKGLIVRNTDVINGVKITSYKAYSEPQNEDAQNLDTQSKNYTEVVQNLDGGSLNFRHNNLNNNLDNIKESTPKGVPKKSQNLQDKIEIEKENFRKELEAFRGRYTDDMLEDFVGYWCEPYRNPIGNKLLRWQGEKTWDLSRRLVTWARVDAEKRQRQRQRPQMSSSPRPLPTIAECKFLQEDEDSTSLPPIDPNSDYAYMAKKRQNTKAALERSKNLANGNNSDGLTILTHDNNR